MAKKITEVVGILNDAIAQIEDSGDQESQESVDRSSIRPHSSFVANIENDLKRAFPSLSGGGNRFQIPSKPKKAKAKGKACFFIQPKETWTHDFCLLSKTSQNISPSMDDLSELREAGLGKRKITFSCKTGDFKVLRETLEKEYEKLKSQDGAFELLRAESGGTSRPLRLLPMPSDGYSIPYLKSIVSNNTLIYIRPIKANISRDKVPQVVTATSPFTECPKCEHLFPIFTLRDHVSICQAIEIHDDIVDDDNDEDDAVDIKLLENPVFATVSKSAEPTPASSSTSTGVGFIDEGIASLSKIFPDKDLDSIRQAMVQHGSIELAADALSTKFEDTTAVEKDDKLEVHEMLKKLKTKMKSPLSAETLKVDEEDIAIDFIRYYKSDSFDPKIPIFVKFKGQPGVDSGGLMRQAFSTVFKMLAHNEVPGVRLFTGPPNRVTPIYSSENLLTNIFEILGKMVAHSLIQGGPGFPYFSPAAFWYVATGDLNESICRASYIDVVDPELFEFVERIKEAKQGDLPEISEDPTFIGLLQECGESRSLTDNNKFEMLQALILHSTILKHKGSLDQFRKGLSVLGLLQQIEENPTGFEHFFVHSENKLTAAFVKDLLKLPRTSSSEADKAVEMLNTFIDCADQKCLSAFVSFTTGSALNTGALCSKGISVSVASAEGFFASTCSLELKIPIVSTYADFEMLLNAVLKGKKFTTV